MIADSLGDGRPDLVPAACLFGYAPRPVRSVPMPTPADTAVDRIRSARASAEVADRSLVAAETQLEAAREALSSAVTAVARFVPVGGRSHDDIVAALDAEIAASERAVAEAVAGIDAAVAAYREARAS